MTLFWISAAGMIILALLFVVPPLLRYKPVEEASSDELNLAVIKQQLAELEADMEAGELDQEQYTAARHDLEKELLADIKGGSGATQAEPKSGRWAMGAIALLIPAIALPTYYYLGSPELISRMENAPPAAANTQDPATRHGTEQTMEQSMVTMVEKLAQRLEQEPNNPEGWNMLARSYLAMDRPNDALNAYEKAYSLNPKNADLLLGYATTLAKLNGNNFSGRPATLIGEAVALDPTNLNALWLQGIVSYQIGNYARAIQMWQPVLNQLDPGSEEAANVLEYIDSALEQLPPGTVVPPLDTASIQPPKAETKPAATAAAKPAQVGSASAIKVTISLDPSLAEKAKPEDRVFIFARALQGPRMPLAAARRQVRDLPVTLVLDDSMAMTPQMVLSNFKQVVVGARITKSGDPIPKSGDLEGEFSPVAPGQSDEVQVVINSILP